MRCFSIGQICAIWCVQDGGAHGGQAVWWFFVFDFHIPPSGGTHGWLQAGVLRWGRLGAGIGWFQVELVWLASVKLQISCFYILCDTIYLSSMDSLIKKDYCIVLYCILGHLDSGTQKSIERWQGHSQADKPYQRRSGRGQLGSRVSRLALVVYRLARAKKNCIGW